MAVFLNHHQRREGAEPLLAVNSLYKRFPSPRGGGELTVLAGVELTVYRGEFLSIIGRSGCGKTTLLRCIAGFEKPSRGSLLIEGREITGPGIDRMMVFQETDQLFLWLTVLGNVEFALQAAGVPRRERRARAVHYLEMVGLERFLEYYPHQLSGGMKQRVAIARALSVAPRMLLMDEPFAALDAMTRNVLQQELLRLWQETKITIIFVTHNIQEAIIQSDRILVLRPLLPANGANTPCGAADNGSQRPLSSIAALIENTLPRPRRPDMPGFGAIWRQLNLLIGHDGEARTEPEDEAEAVAESAAEPAGAIVLDGKAT
ncbi:MAG: ABC transporter ATP-binding protein [Limnochordales bacterium]|nr:ABC transporter ATP-binding protein [Limnochordales bacterium]